MNQRQRVLVLGADATSPNLGVQALAAGALALLRKIWPDCEVLYQNFDNGDCPSVTTRKKMLNEVAYRGEIRDFLRGMDLVLDVAGGDSFTDIYGLRRLSHIYLLRYLVQRESVPLVLAPQTIGPFSSWPSRLLARSSMGHAQLVCCRDDASFEVAKRLSTSRIVLASDLVFALNREHSVAPEGILFNVSGLLWRPNPHVDNERYREVMVDVLNSLITSGRKLSLLVHVTPGEKDDEDSETAHALQASLIRPVAVVEPQSLADARRVIAGAEVVVGARMHACLNAISQGVPTVPLAYSRKFEPLFDTLGWPVAFDLRNSAAVGEQVEIIEAAIDRAIHLAPLAEACATRGNALLNQVADLIKETVDG